AGILARWPIPQMRIVAHSDIAPERKEDPGERFPWKTLAEAGVGLWPKAQATGAGAIKSDEVSHNLGLGASGPQVESLQSKLKAIGYKIDLSGTYDATTQHVVRAFQRRWRPTGLSGEADRATLALIEDLAQLSR